MALPPKHLASIKALADILIPPGGSLEAGASEAGVPERIDSWTEAFSPRMRRRFGLLVSAWDTGPVLAKGYLRRFHRLPPERQESWVAAAYRSRRLDRRMPISYLKQIIFLAYASSPEFEERVGYDYTCRLDGEPHGAGPTP